jgi:hypothetical protein
MTTARTRCFRVEIETPPNDAEKSVAYHRDRILEDGDTIVGRAVAQPSAIRTPFLPGLAQTVREIVDPVTGETVRMSGAGLAAWITADYEERNAADEARASAEQTAMESTHTININAPLAGEEA